MENTLVRGQVWDSVIVSIDKGNVRLSANTLNGYLSIKLSPAQAAELIDVLKIAIDAAPEK